MITLKRSVYSDKDFINLTLQLDEDLTQRYNSYQEKFDAQNKMDINVKTVVAWVENKAVACGALRPMDEPGVIEIKRMFVQPDFRGNAIGKKILQELETWAKEEKFALIRLETGKNQPEAIKLYQQAGYRIIEPYGNYRSIEEAICMEKKINSNIKIKST